jgi:hypothetical protein
LPWPRPAALIGGFLGGIGDGIDYGVRFFTSDHDGNHSLIGPAVKQKMSVGKAEPLFEERLSGQGRKEPMDIRLQH